MGYKGSVVSTLHAAVDTFAEDLRRHPFTQEERASFAWDAMGYVNSVLAEFVSLDVAAEALGVDIPTAPEIYIVDNAGLGCCDVTESVSDNDWQVLSLECPDDSQGRTSYVAAAEAATDVEVDLG